VFLLDIGEMVGRGRRAEVYALGNDKVLKLYQVGVDRTWPEREADLTRRVNEAGVPSPRVFEVVSLSGRVGIVYERVEGPTLEDQIRANPGKVQDYACLHAELHAEIHKHVLEDLPSQRDAQRRAIERGSLLSCQIKNAALESLQALPDGNALCHGDLNVQNVILSPRGPVVIDWDNACKGNPLADVARVMLLMRMGKYHSRSREEREAVERLTEEYRRAYAERYLELRPGTMEELQAWTFPLAAARVAENISEEQEALLAVVAAALPSKSASRSLPPQD